MSGAGSADSGWKLSDADGGALSLNMQHNRFYAKTPRATGVAKATADLNGVPLPLREFSAQFRTRWLTRRFTWGIWAAVAPLTPGQYVLEIKATTHNGFRVDTTYHLEATAP
ncbi:hypothetical protein [Streptomyces sp. NPDC088748]|uniref:hypothetical protein n=1 Tax=Streptomyces sp. NPDC088748 TaxID=3365887 RepID=UPI00380D7234